MADTIFNSFLEYVGDGTMDMDNDTFKAALVEDSYTIDATDTQWSEISANEVSGTGYTAGGKALTNVSWSQTAGTLTFDADDVSWTGASFTARYMVVYNDTASNDELVCLFDFGSNQTVTASTFTYSFNASGIFTIAQA
jgi:hypothetical protein